MSRPTVDSLPPNKSLALGRDRVAVCPHSICECLKPALVCAVFAVLAACAKPETSSKQESPQAAAEEALSAKNAAEGLVVFSADAVQLRQIAVEQVRTVSVPADEVDAPAKIEVNPNRVSHALLPVPGRIVSVMARLGDAVVQGQPIVTIEGPALGEAETAYIQAESGRRQAELAAAKADADLARAKVLYEHGVVAEKDLLAAQTTQALSKASVDQAKTASEQARQRLELLGLKPGQFQQQAKVASPISGKVLEINVVEGEYHNEINAPLFTIADLSRVWVSSDVPESAIRYFRVGGLGELELIAYPHETFQARVTRIADTVDSDTRTIKVSAELDNPAGRLRPQMFGRLRYEGSMTTAVWVPEGAVVQVNGKDVVFVEQGPGRFLATTVELGRRYKSGYAIRNGLSKGQRIVAAGAVYVKAGL
jgi:membrane fusion protein, heavy metal efflux system